jgi:hypothetical protein
MQKHFVTFYSPGTFVAENTAKEISSWDIEQAKAIAQGIVERHGATPYGFRFSTRSRQDDELDSKETATSPMYYLGGIIWTLEALKAKNDPQDRILIGNMERNRWSRVVINTNSYRWTQPLHDDDVVLEWEVHNATE